MASTNPENASDIRDDITQQLPNEILSEIFWHLVKELSTDPGRRWLAITSVCHRWRDIALSSPELWSTIYIIPHSLAPLSPWFERAKSTLLDVALGGSFVPDDVTLLADLISSHLNHTQSLVMTGIPHKDLLQILPRLDTPAPHINTLAIVYPAGLPPNAQFVLMPSLFSSVAPNLSTLHLKSVSVPWTLSLFSGLSCLELSNEHPTAHPSSELFLAVLENCPQLSRLHLHESGPISTPPEISNMPPPRRANLPHLTLLKLEYHASEYIAHVLSHISLRGSPSEQLVISLTTFARGWDIANDFGKYLQFLAEKNHPEPPSWRSLRLVSVPSRRDLVSVSCSADHLSHRLPRSAASSLTLEVWGVNAPDVFVEIMTRGIPSPQRPKIFMLAGWRDLLSSRDWEDSLQEWDELQSILLNDVSEEPFFWALTPDVDDNGFPMVRTLCPKLKYICMEHDLSPTGKCEEVSDGWFSSLESLLLCRGPVTARLPLLELINVSVPAPRLELLRCHVGQLLMTPGVEEVVSEQ
ncbi:hypothetical protein JAAARDRAFT_42800 [Jaapia argillacea MUCL 33604]|uniref:F-box domain-containing protein n=1 Tax=Jaapia argillacea MUCL 33604 TaxID=933084 RepID=A0A067PGA5_9AGAM|nr:hypothetical protein JAAARDRAFT_42800 [Jaapia argillacea MUCL 33604]